MTERAPAATPAPAAGARALPGLATSVIRCVGRTPQLTNTQRMLGATTPVLAERRMRYRVDRDGREVNGWGHTGPDNGPVSFDAAAWRGPA